MTDYSNPAHLEVKRIYFQDFELSSKERANNAETQAAAEQEVAMEALTSGSNKVKKIKMSRNDFEQLFLYRLLLRLTWSGKRSKTRRPW